MAHTGLLRIVRTLGALLGGALTAVVACDSPDFEIPAGDQPTSTTLGVGGTGGSASTGGTLGTGGMGGGLPEHCSSGAPDGNETGPDCGGPDCEPCRVGEPCRVDRDCVNEECTQGICRDASCTDDVLNGNESDVDCGGGTCPACPPGRICRNADDCLSSSCDGRERICLEDNCTDRVQNGSETDIDCGGGECPGCEVGDRCLLPNDCLPPPDTRSESVSCDEESQRCVLLCGSGTADCNQSAADGCEVTLNTDIEHCGECGNACDLDGADAQCQGGRCQIVACWEGFQNCNNETEDGCEVDIESDPDNCGACGDVCSDRNGTPACNEGVCSLMCDEGFDDCNDDLVDGCEANLNRSVDHCQECGALCQGSSAELTPFCDGGGDGCGETECEPGLGDCDGDAECTDDLGSIEDCGRCGNTCDVPHGTPACVEGECAVDACDADAGRVWADCDQLVANGCERDLDSDRRFCGDCANDCTAILDSSLHVSDVGCREGGCIITSCESGWANCDGEFENGCEVDVTSDSLRCGGCSDAGGVDCSAEYENGSGGCEESSCVFLGCDQSYGDCNLNAGAGSAQDGCETEIVFNDDHCGGCGLACEVGAGTESNSCAGNSGDICLPVCEDDYDDCDEDPNNGCEQSLLDSDEHCGVCGNACEDVNSDNECVEGVCVPDCDAGFLSCDDDPADGCEQSVTVVAHCGDCDDDCSGAGGGTPACSMASECSVSCSGNMRSCNDENVARDGCETNIDTSVNHCGGCGESCGSANVDTRGCTGGTCTPTCDDGFCVAGDPADGCTAQLGTPEHCAACGQSCAAPTPFCESDGGFHCDFLDIEVVNSTTGDSGAWASGQAVLRVDHTLEGASGDYRLVVIGVASNQGAPLQVDYFGTALGAPVVSATLSEAWVGIYTALDEQLPSAGARQVTVQFQSGWGWGQVDVVELAGVDQTDTIVASADASSGDSCSASGLRSAGVSFSAVPGSFVYAMLGARQGSTATLASGNFISTFNEPPATPQGSSERGLMAAAYSGPQSSGSTASWTVTDCYRSVGAAIGIRRAESL